MLILWVHLPNVTCYVCKTYIHTCMYTFMWWFSDGVLGFRLIQTVCVVYLDMYTLCIFPQITRSWNLIGQIFMTGLCSADFASKTVWNRSKKGQNYQKRNFSHLSVQNSRSEPQSRPEIPKLTWYPINRSKKWTGSHASSVVYSTNLYISSVRATSS